MKKILVILNFFFISLAYSDELFIQNVRTTMDVADVYAEIQRALVERKWEIISNDGGGVTGKIDHRGVKATVTIYKSGDNLLYKCDGTREVKMRYAAGSAIIKKRKEVIEYCPKKWVDNLRHDVSF